MYPSRKFSATIAAITALIAVSSSVAQTTPVQPIGLNQATTRIHSGHSQTSMAGIPLKEALVKKLVKANEAEIELAKMAQSKTENDDVRQLTKMIVSDHQSCVEKLKACCHDQTNNSQTAAGQVHQQQNPNVQQTHTAEGAPLTAQTVMVPQQLCDIGEKACENTLKMTKEMLSQYEGQDFTMAFLGQQMVAHTAMLAELKAIQSAGPEDLKPVVGPAISKVEEHLEKIKDLAEKYEDESRSEKNG